MPEVTLNNALDLLRTAQEAETLEENEQIIRKGRASFIAVGKALMNIRANADWYEALGFDTFERYCRGQWEFLPNYAGRLIRAAEIGEACQQAKLMAPPSESVARPLTELSEKHGTEHAVAIWDDIVKHYAGDVTQARVRDFISGDNDGSKSKPGWTELLGTVGEELAAAERKLRKLMDGVSRKPSQKFATLADHYAERCDVIAYNLRNMPGDWTEPGGAVEEGSQD